MKINTSISSPEKKYSSDKTNSDKKPESSEINENSNSDIDIEFKEKIQNDITDISLDNQLLNCKLGNLHDREKIHFIKNKSEEKENNDSHNITNQNTDKKLQEGADTKKMSFLENIHKNDINFTKMNQNTQNKDKIQNNDEPNEKLNLLARRKQKPLLKFEIESARDGELYKSLQKAVALGVGLEGTVYVHPENKNIAIKSFGVAEQNDQTHLSALAQSLCINAYYGQNESTVFIDPKDSRLYMTMPKIEGKTIRDIKNHGPKLPNNSVELFQEMLDRLAENKIIPGDINADNVMFDNVNKRFCPIDMQNCDPENIISLEEYNKNCDKLRRTIERRIEKGRIE